MTPDSLLKSVASCNGEFNYDESKAGRIKLRIRHNDIAPTDREGKPGTSSERTYPQWIYDFDNEERADDNLQDISNNELDNFTVTSDDTTPSTSQRVDLNIKARDSDNATVTDYTDTVKFKVYYRSSSSSSWTQTTSSTYYEMDSDYDGGYDFTSSDD
jgi:VCBS repeat-containing protein